MKSNIALRITIAKEVSPLTTHEAVAVCVFQNAVQPSGASTELRATIEQLISTGEFEGEAETSLLLHTADAEHDGSRRLLLLGCGEHGENGLPTISRAASIAVRRAQDAHLKRLYFILPAYDENNSLVARAIAEGAILGSYRNDFYRKRDDAAAQQLTEFTIIAATPDDSLKTSIERGRIVAESVNWARELADEPGASLPPREFARRAAGMAAEFNLRVESLTAAEVKARGMGGLIGVGQGSDEEPALIVLRYEPEHETETDELWAFVGKGITFDTGGISLKPHLNMEDMKSDMAGGAAALGAMRAIAQLKPQRRIVAVVPAAENMPSGRAIKPGDIVKTLAGYTIEVVDTDAEGRLVLVDGIAYARQLGATRIVDLATLTGSIIIALGDHRTGLFSNNDQWANEVRAAAERAGEPVWRMPVGDDYKKRIESAIADFKNYGGHPDASAAALLLSKFASDTPWVHLDIAGTAWYGEAQPFAPKGTTGTGVRTLVELACGG
ncbi:MAG: leucyl aminopeptidase [Pyrinomonadaceae bacterium]